MLPAHSERTAGDEALSVQIEVGDAHADHVGDGKDEFLQGLAARERGVGLLLEDEHEEAGAPAV